METITGFEPFSQADALFLKLSDDAYWRVRSHRRLHGGLITGAAGSGKTVLARRIALGAVKAGLDVSVYDPIKGNPIFINGASFCLSPDQIRESLQRTAETEIPLRRDGGWRPGSRDRDRLIVIDHLELLIDDRAVLAAIERIARTGSKLGVALVLAGQFDFRSLPSACQEGNLLALSWRAQRELVRFGVRTEAPATPACHVDATTGVLIGFDPRA